jgi:hypothetical protein
MAKKKSVKDTLIESRVKDFAEGKVTKERFRQILNKMHCQGNKILDLERTIFLIRDIVEANNTNFPGNEVLLLCNKVLASKE